SFLWLAFITHNFIANAKQLIFAETTLVDTGMKELVKHVGNIRALVGIISIPIMRYSNLNKFEITGKLLSDLKKSESFNAKDEPYKNLVIIFIHPYVMDAVHSYYNKYLKESPVVNPNDIKIINIEKDKAAYYTYLLTVEATPYIGPHNTIGVDHITLKVKPYNEVSIEKFQHIESFPIAPGWQEIIKKWPPK
ncbi:MAG: hypothetical protein K0R93_2892, partial [Anaerosolibacter sp.]|uniref:DUF3888 domain-containing protein n=1 Tax=Anaerosolibacter sp. TaxID=1872527 RepID=UPI002628ABC7